MVKLSRPSSFGRKQSAGTGGNGKSGWTKPVEFNRSSSSKRRSFRKTESAGPRGSDEILSFIIERTEDPDLPLQKRLLQPEFLDRGSLRKLD